MGFQQFKGKLLPLLTSKRSDLRQERLTSSYILLDRFGGRANINNYFNTNKSLPDVFWKCFEDLKDNESSTRYTCLSLWEQLFRYAQRGSMIIQWLLPNRKKNESWGFKSLRSLNSKHMSMGCLSQWPTDRANPRTITSMAKSQSHFLHRKEQVAIRSICSRIMGFHFQCLPDCSSLGEFPDSGGKPRELKPGESRTFLQTALYRVSAMTIEGKCWIRHPNDGS
ncbi:hypothetical protein NA56DRAFT_745669 [Hyaloscypha hepaticicola]|uniref:Uncharacterized protein n=1 Tax=Hyaloscypha hepaticicola TaxID=2082293 RepID=A0A2J6QFM7_9HELO|nr:hypothetical protein NA56DRAFT_745669 [Hyaloscypha hepaticicola]